MSNEIDPQAIEFVLSRTQPTQKYVVPQTENAESQYTFVLCEDKQAEFYVPFLAQLLHDYAQERVEAREAAIVEEWEVKSREAYQLGYGHGVASEKVRIVEALELEKQSAIEAKKRQPIPLAAMLWQEREETINKNINIVKGESQ